MRRLPSAAEEAYTLVSVEDARDTRETLLHWAGPALTGHRLLDQPAFNRNRLEAEKLINSKVLE